MSKPLICHVVAGYPDTKACLALMKGMAKLGVSAIEVQIPFSDPIADGEVIMHANDVALEKGMTTKDSFALIHEARRQGVTCDIYVMSYVQKVQHFGLERFCDEAEACGAKGLIMPDLPYDSPEYKHLSVAAGNLRLELVPVLSPGMPKQRLEALLEVQPQSVYVTSQRGITGNAYTGTSELEQLAAVVKQRSDANVMIGFGIRTPKDVADALQIGDAAIVGSAIITRLQSSNLTETLEYVGTLAGSAA